MDVCRSIERARGRRERNVLPPNRLLRHGEAAAVLVPGPSQAGQKHLEQGKRKEALEKGADREDEKKKANQNKKIDSYLQGR